MKLAPLIASFLLTATMVPEALAQTTVKGRIAGIHATGGGNYAFRVYLEGQPAMCGSGTADWAYMNTNFDNYQATVALLTSAYLAARPVAIVSQAGAKGYCQIIYVII